MLFFFRRKHGELALKPSDRGSEALNKVSRPIARNPIQIAREFHHCLMSPEVKGYKQVAEQFGVTKASISHYLSILQRLPQEFVEWLERCDTSVVLAHFTESRLRPVTRLPRSEQIRWLTKVASQLDATISEIDELLEVLSF